MASYDSETDIHTMTLNEAQDYLKSLSKNTMRTPYKVKITNFDIYREDDKYKLNRLVQEKSSYSGERFLDLSPTEIIFYGEQAKDLFKRGHLIILPPKLNIKYGGGHL